MSSNLQTRFLGPAEIESTLVEVADLARAQGVPLIVVGGVAMAAYGSDRLTTDIDFASTTPLAGIVQIKRLSFGGISGKSSDGHPVDVIVRDDEYAPLYEAALAHPRDVGLPVPVVSPEYLAALKMAAARPKDEEDLRTLIRLGLDRPATRKVVRLYLGEYAARELDAVCDEIDWRASREK